MNVSLHIERLVLEGLPVEAADAPALQAAVEAELTRLLAEQGIAREMQAGGAYAETRGGILPPHSWTAPEVLGREIGRAVYGGIGR
jgi:hypothetical protein